MDTSRDYKLSSELDALREEMRRFLDGTAYLFVPHGPVTLDEGIDFRNAVAAYERALIITALRIANRRQNRAAELLRLHESTLSTKLRALGIDPRRV